jgi:hypothetical protein
MKTMFVGILLVLSVAASHSALAFAQSPVISFFKTGAALRFEAEDVLSVQFVDQEGQGQIALTLSAAMSQRLQAFTENLVGGTIMTVSGGKVLSAGTVVRTSISGPVIHISGSDQAAMGLVLERMVDRRNAGETVLVAYEQMSRLDLDAADITRIEGADDPEAGALRVSADHAVADVLPAEPDSWIAAIDGDVIEAWSVAERDGAVEVTLHALTPDQRAVLQPSMGEGASGLQ